MSTPNSEVQVTKSFLKHSSVQGGMLCDKISMVVYTSQNQLDKKILGMDPPLSCNTPKVHKTKLQALKHLTCYHHGHGPWHGRPSNKQHTGLRVLGSDLCRPHRTPFITMPHLQIRLHKTSIWWQKNFCWDAARKSGLQVPSPTKDSGGHVSITCSHVSLP